MKLFLRDQALLIGFIALQLALVVSVFWLDGYEDFKVAAYALLLGICVFMLYLGLRYYTHRKYYKLLEGTQPDLDELVQKLDAAPVPQALTNLLQMQYSHYQNRIIEGERKQQQHTTFMNHWVHQMKTPLSVLELMLQESGEPRDESMREETDRIRKGLEMVLYMARLETFEQDFHVETVRLREAANEVILDNKRLFIRSFVYPDMRIDQAALVETDGKWLRFILEQLVFNAVKYAAGSHTKLIISSYTNERAVVLELCDSGVGIPASDLSRVFKPFFTGENGRVFKESTGMGLYIVKTVLDKMNHEIELNSQVGVGTTVKVIFPFAAR
jgi:OmpR family two-component system sensor histidine kinase YxdK